MCERIEAREERLGWWAAEICCVIANVNRGKNTRAFEIKDFMPVRQLEAATRTTAEDMLAKIVWANYILGGEDLREAR